MDEDNMSSIAKFMETKSGHHIFGYIQSDSGSLQFICTSKSAINIKATTHFISMFIHAQLVQKLRSCLVSSTGLTYSYIILKEHKPYQQQHGSNHHIHHHQ